MLDTLILITGLVTNSLGHPIQDATISYFDMSAEMDKTDPNIVIIESETRTFQTDQNGRYSFRIPKSRKAFGCFVSWGDTVKQIYYGRFHYFDIVKDTLLLDKISLDKKSYAEVTIKVSQNKQGNDPRKNVNFWNVHQYWDKLNIVLKPNLLEQKVWISREGADCNIYIPPNIVSSSEPLKIAIIEHHIPKRNWKYFDDQPMSKLLQTSIRSIYSMSKIIPPKYYKNYQHYRCFRLLSGLIISSKAITIYLVPEED
jgi:hypothetical protein